MICYCYLLSCRFLENLAKSDCLAFYANTAQIMQILCILDQPDTWLCVFLGTVRFSCKTFVFPVEKIWTRIMFDFQTRKVFRFWKVCGNWYNLLEFSCCTFVCTCIHIHWTFHITQEVWDVKWMWKCAAVLNCGPPNGLLSVLSLGHRHSVQVVGCQCIVTHEAVDVTPA